jgi:SAM-dependent methyltransferase
VAQKLEDHDAYFSHLQKISVVGRLYKRLFSSPLLFSCARRFGPRIVEIGSGIGSGVLGAFPKYVRGLEINPAAVDYCRRLGLDVQLIDETTAYPVRDAAFDACILDNVLEHIADPGKTLDECHRITQTGGGLVVAVPGCRGFASDADHKRFYDAGRLKLLDARWSCLGIFSMPFIVTSEWLSKSVKQYCLVGTYRKK